MGVLIVFFILFLLFISFLLLLFPLIFKQGATVVADIPGYYQNLRNWMVFNPNPFIVQLGGFLPGVLPGLNPIQQSGQQVMDLAGQVMNIFSTGVKVIFVAAAFLLLVYHWTLDGPKTIQSLLLLFSKSKREGIDQLIADLSVKMSFYIAGQSVLCLIIGILALIAYLIIGLPNALVLALIAGILEAVPMIGPILGAIPAGVIALSIAPSKLIWVVLATLVIQQLEAMLLVPRVMRKAVGVNPFVTLLSIFAFSSLFGIAGTLMAIPMAAIIQVLLNRFVFHPENVEPESSTERDYASRLRYETQELADDLRKQARLEKEGSDFQVNQIDHVMDEIEVITTDLDALLAGITSPGLQ
jgi:predicted PurR-regulated permease PerM